MMYCNYYAPEIEEHVGNQPVRVFYPEFKNIFLNVTGNIMNEFNQCPEIHGRVDIEKVAALSPKVVYNRIFINESFLSLLWCCCYGVFSMTPIRDVGKRDFKTGLFIIKYGLGLLHQYAEWDKINLPNPEYYQKSQHELIGRANMCYLVALNFIFYHECAHFVYDDIESTIENEKRADLFALERVTALNNGQYRESILAGILSAMATILLISNEMRGVNHPDPDQRIRYILEKLELDENDFAWGYATYSLMIWKLIYKSDWKFPKKYETTKQYFYDFLENIEEWKR